MAIIKFINSKTSLKKTLEYVTQEIKTNDNLISTINCNRDSAFEEMMLTKRKFNKLNGREKLHIVQSFSPKDNIDYEKAHKLGIELANQFKEYEIVIATHKDKEHIHNHIIINSVNLVNGKKIHTSKKDLEKLKELSNKLCLKHGLSITLIKNNETKDIRNNELQVMLKGSSWKARLMNAIDFCMKNTNTRQDFIFYMNQLGYEVNWKDTRKYITYTTPENMKCRDNKLHEEKYLKEKMEDYYGIKRDESITNSSVNECKNGGTSKETSLFRTTNTEVGNYKIRDGYSNESNTNSFKGCNGKIISNERSSKRYKRNDKASKGFTKQIDITNKDKIYDNRNGDKLINNNDYITNNKLNNALLSLFLNSNNKVTQNETETLSELNSSEKLQYLKDKHYSLEELEEEI